jgi:hypothetical protein
MPHLLKGASGSEANTVKVAGELEPALSLKI